MKLPIILILFVSLLGVSAQDVTNSATTKTGTGSRIELLESLHSSLSAKKGEIERLEAELKDASNETTRQAVSDTLQSSASEYLELKKRFEESVAGVDHSLFIDEPEETFSWEENLGDIVKPIVSEIKNATAESRKIAELRKTSEEYSERAEAAAKAIDQIEKTLTAGLPEEMSADLNEQLAVWIRRAEVARNQADAADLQLREIMSTQKSVMENSKEFFRNFMSSRGLSLLYGMLAFLVLFFGIRLAVTSWQKKKQNSGNLTLNDRIVNLSARAAAILFGMIALIVVFNLRSDWFLLCIVLVFFLGLIWLSIKALPHYIEAVSFVLNVGPVREGEIIDYHGVLWVVESIGFKTYLKNDRLEGGWLRVPYRNLLDQLSRPGCESEVLFPTEKGDWILIGGTLAEVIVQTPSQVTVRHDGGARVSYSVGDFLGATPINLSQGFRLETAFGVDYSLQSLAPKTIPDAMLDALKKELGNIVPEESIKEIFVHFASAAASSLDFEIEVDLDGSVAHRYQAISFALQRILVELCTEKDWEIPFPQLTVSKK